ncbi:Vi polysaccharide biosynthesis protein VipB/TviC [Desulfocarbo indianensis]|nr:Vi polysaccharide biosynthesis protein VipB/TviC [Desulfocarbo indianensis]
MTKYLITGGAGFIGSHLAETLIKRGEDVVVLDNLSTGKRENLRPAEGGPGRLVFMEADMRDMAVCREAMRGVDFVLHQAARPSVQRSVEDPMLSHDVNVNGGLNILISAKEAGVKRVVTASSSSIYGDRQPADAPKREDMDPRPMSPYAANKVAMEYYCRVFYKVYGLETVCLRYFNVFGPRQDPRSAYAAVIPRFMFALLEGARPTIFGDGKQSRDFTYIENVVAANLAACTASGAAGESFNVASGSSQSLLRLVEVLEQLTGKKADPEFAPPRTGDVRFSLADLSKTREVLGYRVGVGFEQGLAVLVDLARRGEYLP